MAKELKDILYDDKAFESVLTQAMAKVGRERDEKRLDAIGNMSEAEFRNMIATLDEKPEPKKLPFLGVASLKSAFPRAASLKLEFPRPVFFKLAAACAVIVCIIGGINYINLGTTDSAGYASLFNTYYKGDQVNWQTFDAGDDRLNTANQPSTAALLERATKMLSKKTDRSTRAGIKQLEHLLTLNYKKSLEHEIRWYLGLGYMRNGQIDEAINEFERVVSLNSPHSKDAATLSKQLKK